MEEFEGVSGANPATDEWYVPYRFYRLMSMTLFHNGSKTSGFSVTFSPYPDDEFIGWTSYEYLFGSDSLSTDLDVTFERDFTSF